MANRHMKRCSRSLIIREMQVKTIRRYHLTLIRMAISKSLQIKTAREGVAEKAMAPHSRTLAWKIPWMEEPGRLQSMGSLGVGHG